VILGGAEIVRDALAEFVGELESFLKLQTGGIATVADALKAEPTAKTLERIEGAPPARRVASLEGRLIEALQRAPKQGLPLQAAAVLAGVSPISGAFHAAKNAIVAGHALETLDWHGDVDPLTSDEVVGAWQTKLGGMASRILGQLWFAGAQDKEAVADALGVSAISGSYHGGWKKLRTNLLIEPAEAGRFRLVAVLRDLPRAKKDAAA
jgi:hypothetical protein